MVTINGLFEIGIQIIISLIIGLILVIPIFAVYYIYKKWKIKKKVPEKLKVKGGFLDNDKTTQRQTEEGRRKYPTADREFLREYAERRFFEGKSSDIDRIGERKPAIERRDELNDIKREIKSSGGIQSSDNSTVRVNKSDFKRDWAKFD